MPEVAALASEPKLGCSRWSKRTMRATGFPFVLFFSFVSAVALASAQASYLPVATWLNDAAHEDDGARVIAALHAGGLAAVATCSAGCTLSVPSGDYAAAIRIAAEVVAREHLDVRVIASLPSS